MSKSLDNFCDNFTFCKRKIRGPGPLLLKCMLVSTDTSVCSKLLYLPTKPGYACYTWNICILAQVGVNYSGQKYSCPHTSQNTCACYTYAICIQCKWGSIIQGRNTRVHTFASSQNTKLEYACYTYMHIHMQYASSESGGQLYRNRTGILLSRHASGQNIGYSM